MKELTSDYPVVVEFPIAWGDMDAFQHVNNVVYFKYFESSRISYFEKINFLEVMTETGIGPILASTECKYKIPLTYPDTVSVCAKVKKMDEDRFVMSYAVVSHKHKKIAASGEGMLVTFNYRTNEKVLIPDSIREKIIGLEKGVNNHLV